MNDVDATAIPLPIVPSDISSKKPESIFKVASKWASFTKDFLSSVKDFGIIMFFLALLLFRKPVIEYLDQSGMRPNKLNLLGGIELSIEEMSNFAESDREPIQIQSQTALTDEPKELPGPPAQLANFETTVLQAPESRLIKDWAIVVAGYQSLDQAVDGARYLEQQTGQTASVFRKRNSFRLVVQVGDRQLLDKSLAIVRKSIPRSYLVSLGSWCGEIQPKEGFVVCSAQ